MAKIKDFFALTYVLQCPQYLERSYMEHNGPQVWCLIWPLRQLTSWPPISRYGLTSGLSIFEVLVHFGGYLRQLRSMKIRYFVVIQSLRYGTPYQSPSSLLSLLIWRLLAVEVMFHIMFQISFRTLYVGNKLYVND